MIPEVLGDFTIEGLLGEGGSSLVYAARHLGEPIALKVLHPELGLSPRETERFLEEASRLQSLSHPGIVALRSSGLLPDLRPFIAMPRLVGRSLASRLASGPLSVEHAIRLFLGVAEAVSALHAAGLIHRDIKPENVLWLEGEERLVLLDLGIAREVEGKPSTTTRAGLARGTPQYMAPERLFGQRASVRTDVYELALLLHVMLDGTLPWKDDDPQGRLDPHLSPELTARIPPGLVTTLHDAMALDPQRRPASVAELALRVSESVPIDVSDRAETLELVPSTGDEPRLIVTPNGPVSIGRSYAPTALQATPLFETAPTELHATPLFETAPTELHATPRAVVIESAFPAHPTLPSASKPPPGPLARAASSIGRSWGLVLGLGAAFALMGGIATVVVRQRMPSRATEGSASAHPNVADPYALPPPSPEASPSSSVVSPDASATADAKPEPGPSASGSAHAHPEPTAPPPTPTTTVSAPPSLPASASATVPPGPAPPICSAFVALFCTPGSMGTPEECAAHKSEVTHWNATLPPDVTREVCQTAYTNSKSGLEARKKTPIPR